MGIPPSLFGVRKGKNRSMYPEGSVRPSLHTFIAAWGMTKTKPKGNKLFGGHMSPEEQGAFFYTCHLSPGVIWFGGWDVWGVPCPKGASKNTAGLQTPNRSPNRQRTTTKHSFRTPRIKLTSQPGSLAGIRTPAKKDMCCLARGKQKGPPKSKKKKRGGAVIWLEGRK